jgi:hypothetical protein
VLSIGESMDIVINCIHDLNGRDAGPDDHLGQIGFPDRAAVDVLCDEIATSTTSGVPAPDYDGHAIDRATLHTVTPQHTVKAVARAVRKNARPSPG